MTPPVILVPLDADKRTLGAFWVARAFARLQGATVVILHVDAASVSPEPAQRLGPVSTPEPAQRLGPVSAPELARRLGLVSAPELARRLGLARDDLAGVVVDIRSGQVDDAILEAARDKQAAAIVLCTPSHAHPPGELGAIAARVLREARCPVVMLRPAHAVSTWALRRVLLPHDATPTSNAAIGPAADLARAAGALLYVLHVAGPADASPQEPGSLPPPHYVDQRQHEWPAWAGEFMERVACVSPLPISHLRLSLARGHASEEIVRFAGAHSVDLIVLASHGETEHDRARIVRAVLSNAPCPVMLVHK